MIYGILFEPKILLRAGQACRERTLCKAVLPHFWCTEIWIWAAGNDPKATPLLNIKPAKQLRNNSVDPTGWWPKGGQVTDKTFVGRFKLAGTPSTPEQIKHFKSAAAGLRGRTAGNAIVKSILDFYKAEITVLDRYAIGELFRNLL